MARWIGRFFLWMLGAAPYAAAALRFLIDRVIGLPGVTGDAQTWWDTWLPVVRTWAQALEASPTSWVTSTTALLIAGWLVWPDVRSRLRLSRAGPVEIVFADRQPFHRRAKESIGDGDDLEFNCYFLGVRNPTRDKVAHDVRVRVVKVDAIPNIPELDLVYTQWFQRFAFTARTSVDLAPNQTCYFQFLVQLVSAAERFPVWIRSEINGYGIHADTTLTIKVAAFCQEGSDIAEFILSPGQDRLSTLRPKRNIAP